MGWQKLLSQASFNNTDFHDQLLTFAGSIREPVTLLAEVESSLKVRYLVLGTQSRLFILNEYSGNWKLLGSGFGGSAGTDLSGARFQVSVLGDYLVVTNGFDRPIYSIIGAASPDTSVLALNQIADLTLIGLQLAKKTWVWKNCVFLADVVMDGIRLSHRLVWSDYNAPISFDPAVTGSITGFQDLDSGERILAGMECGNEFLIYTTRNVWSMYVNQGTGGPAFGFRKLPGITEEVCLAYENAIVNVGDGHVYMGKNRMYFFNQYIGLPDPLEWAFNSMPAIYDNIVQTMCAAPVAGYNNKEAYFSVLTSKSVNGLPDVTLRIHKDFRMVDTIDSGFSAICSYRPQNVPSLREWLIDLKACTPEEMQANGFGWTNEGLPNPMPTPSAAFAPACVYTHQTTTVAPGLSVEDTSQPSPAPDSLCALLATGLYANIQQFCNQCETKPILVAASSEDMCLKQIGDEFNPTFYRERCANPSATGTTASLGYTSATGNYLLDGYDSIIRFAPMFVDQALVVLNRIQLNYLAAQQTTPSNIAVRVGVSGQVADPNDDSGGCPIKWFTLSTKQLRCLNTLQTQQQFANKNAVPSVPLDWNFLYKGRYVFIEISISGTGGDSLLSGIVAGAGSEMTKNY